jgi:4-amino-4-deoxy-L-arabinose transferase-like glycosyltransferase
LRELSTAPWVFPLILSVALALRVGHISALRSTLWFDHLDLDARYFDEWGSRIAAGDWMGSRVFFVDPLYPYLLGVLYWLFGHQLLLIRLLQAAVGVSTVALVGYLGRQLGSRAVGNAAALMYAIYAPAIFNDAEIEKTAFATFFLLLAVTQALRGTRPGWWLSGVALGLATLCRANMIVLALPLALYAARGSNGWSLRRAVPLLGGCALVLAPVVWRNYHVGGELVIVGSAGQNLYLGNNPYNTGGSYGRLPFVRPTPEYEEDDFRRAAEARTGRAMRSGEVSRYWAGAAADHVRAHPWFAAQMLIQKGRLLFNHYEVPDNQDMYFVARYSPILRWSLPGFGWIFPLGVLGLIVSWPRRDVRLIAAIMAVYSCSVILFFVLARFRQPLIPFWVVFAALGGRWLVRAAWRREFRRVAMAGAVVAACVLVTVQSLPFHDRGVNLALAWHNLGALQARVGRFEQALASEEVAARLLPDHVDIVTSLGRFYLHLARLEEAERALLHAVAVDPAASDAWLALGDVYQQTGREHLARDSYDRANVSSGTRRSPPDAGSGP